MQMHKLAVAMPRLSHNVSKCSTTSAQKSTPTDKTGDESGSSFVAECDTVMACTDTQQQHGLLVSGSQGGQGGPGDPPGGVFGPPGPPPAPSPCACWWGRQLVGGRQLPHCSSGSSLAWGVARDLTEAAALASCAQKATKDLTNRECRTGSRLQMVRAL